MAAQSGTGPSGSRRGEGRSQGFDGVYHPVSRTRELLVLISTGLASGAIRLIRTQRIIVVNESIDVEFFTGD